MVASVLRARAVREESLIAAGGLCAPAYAMPALKPGDTWTETYRVQGRLRRWWWRRTGWSIEWTVEYVYEGLRVVDTLPAFSATRGALTLRH